MPPLLFGPNCNSLGTVGITKILCPREMSSAMPGASDRKPTRRPGRKAPTLRPESNTSVTAGGRVVTHETSMSQLSYGMFYIQLKLGVNPREQK